MSMTPEEKRARFTEQHRRYREANKEKVLERHRRYLEANKEAVAKQRRRYIEANKESVREKDRQYREANKEAVAERNRRWTRRNGFAKEDGSSLSAWSASVYNRGKAFAAIANLTPDPGQTLAQLIHELSGYAMEVCEQIANPPATEDSPALTPPAAPDLF